ERRRQEARAKRLEEERLQQQARDTESRRVRREADAMDREDRSSAAFVAFVARECDFRSYQATMPDVRAKTEKSLEVVLEWRSCEIQWRQGCDLRRQEELELQAKLESERKERDYLEWREQVRQERCQQQRLQARQELTLEKELQAELKRFELQGRDLLREREEHVQAQVEAAIHDAGIRGLRMKERGVSPSRALEEALALAERQRKMRDQSEPVKVEQELWEALLAKNRLAVTRKQAGTKTPRWGVFNT
ncbi:unnamed protein product, partial [Polarella glacialis]